MLTVYKKVTHTQMPQKKQVTAAKKKKNQKTQTNK